LHYEDYSANFNGTNDALFQFLGLERTAQSDDFVAGKTYHDFFQATEIAAIARLLRTVASSALWEVLKRHFAQDADPHVQLATTFGDATAGH
jgi:hypothetical protein